MNRKTNSLLAVAAMSCLLAFGCSQSPSMTNAGPVPVLNVTANHSSIQAGESDRLATTSMNLTDAKDIKWSVTPTANGVRVVPDKDMANKTALFEADQPGTYVVRAEADLGDGHTIHSDATIIVNARPGTLSVDH